MLYSLPLLALSLTASAVVLPRQTPACTFYLNAVGPVTGAVRQTKTGQNRIGGNFQQAQYLISDHNLTDVWHQTCRIEPSTLQFQCGQPPSSTQFLLADDGNLAHDGSENWLACPANDGSWNIFSDEKTDTIGCQTIQLRTGGFGCSAMGRPSSSSSALTSTSQVARDETTSSWVSSPTTSETSTATPSCPTDITSGPFEFPHLILPTSSESPDHAFGNSYSAAISNKNTTLFNFDIPSTAPYSSGTCALLFLFPYGTDLDPSAGKYYFSGTEQEAGANGGLNFSLLDNIADASTTFDSTPGVEEDYGKTQIIPGNRYVVHSGSCRAGKTLTYKVESVGRVELDYFQDSAPSAIGLYIVPCL